MTLVLRDLLKEVVTARLALFLLQEQVVCRCNLVVFIVFDEGWCLGKVIAGKVFVQLRNDFGKHWDLILANDYAVHFDRPYSRVPLMTSDVLHPVSLLWISIEHFPNQVF